MIVYKAVNKVTEKVYVGKTVRNLSHAKARHKSRAFRAWKTGCESKFYTAIRKYGWEEFEWSILYNGTSDEDIQEKERYYINELDTLNSGYNLTPGGDGGAGKTLSVTHKAKLSEASTGSNNNCYGLYGADHPAYGNVHTEETKAKIRQANLGKAKTEEHKRKLSEAKKRISRFSQEDRDKMVQLRLDGLTFADIAGQFDASASVVYKIVKKETTSDMRQSTPSSETLA